MLQQFTKAEAAEQSQPFDSSAGINKAAANLSAGSQERTRLRCSSMSSRIVIAFRTHGIHRSCHNRLENGGELPKILGGQRALVGSRGAASRSSIRNGGNKILLCPL